MQHFEALPINKTELVCEIIKNVKDYEAFSDRKRCRLYQLEVKF